MNIKNRIKKAQTQWDSEILRRIAHYGGFHIAHLHLDRVNTLGKDDLGGGSMDPLVLASASLHAKQDLLGRYHMSLAYSKKELERRMRETLNMFIMLGVRRVDSPIDTTPDIGLRALDVGLKLKKEFEDRLELKLGAYAPFGFNDCKPERKKIFLEAADKADFLVGLPERDNRRANSDHIGYDAHMAFVVDAALKRKKYIQIHVDQLNHPEEDGTERLINCVRTLRNISVDNYDRLTKDEPLIWATHVISPSGYGENRFQKLLEGLTEQNIGVICCPSAAVSMIQSEYTKTRTHNSIARVVDMIAAGINVRVGIDNISDVLVPSGPMDPLEDLRMLTQAVRCYKIEPLAKLAAGRKMDNSDVDLMKQQLVNDAETLKVQKEYIECKLPYL